MAGKILYALIARENIVLAEFTATGGNFPTVTRMLLHKINSGEDHKMSYTYDTHVFHYVVEAGITYLCMADVELRRCDTRVAMLRVQVHGASTAEVSVVRP